MGICTDRLDTPLTTASYQLLRWGRSAIWLQPVRQRIARRPVSIGCPALPLAPESRTARLHVDRFRHRRRGIRRRTALRLGPYREQRRAYKGDRQLREHPQLRGLHGDDRPGDPGDGLQGPPQPGNLARVHRRSARPPVVRPVVLRRSRPLRRSSGGNRHLLHHHGSARFLSGHGESRRRTCSFRDYHLRHHCPAISAG